MSDINNMSKQTQNGVEKTKKLIIFGNTNYAEMICDYFEEYSEYEVCLFTVDGKYKEGNEYYGKKIVDFENIENVYKPEDYDMFVAVGSSRLNKVREDICKRAMEKGYNLATFIHPNANVSTKVKVGKNTILMEFCRVLQRTEIGDGVVIWPNAIVSHNNTIKDYAYIVGSTNGFCEIGENCFLASNATIADRVKVAKDNYIAMAAAVRKNTEENSVYDGNPARKNQHISAIDFVKFLELYNK